MKGNRQDRKRKIAGFIAIFMAFLMILSAIAPFIFAAENAAGEVSISAELGYSGLYKVGYPAPLRVEIATGDKAFSGEVSLRISGEKDYRNNSNWVDYAYPVEMNANETKTIKMNVNINTIVSYGTLKIEAIDSNNNVCASQRLSSTAFNPENMMFGILSDNPNNLSYIKEIYSQGYMQKYTKEIAPSLTAENFPDTLNSMKAFNVITINDFDTSSLTNMSKDAIKSWVSAGGILIIGSGENYQKTLKGLGDIIQIEKSESVVSDDLDLLLEEFDEEVYGEETPQLSAEEKQEDKQEETGETEEKKEVGEVNPLSAEKKAAKPIVLELISLGERGNEIKTSLYSSISYGGGKIIIFPFDLGNSAVSKSLRLVDFINTVILAEVNSNAASNNMHNRSGSYVVSPYELRNIPLQNIGTTSLIFAIIIIYIVIAGPVLYIILKKKDRREEGFVVIPCLAIGITLLIFVMSFNTVYKKPIINEVSVINAYPGQRQAVKTSNYAVMTGKKGDISVEINNGDFTPNPFVEDGYYGYYSYGDGKNIKVIYGDKPGLKYYANERWDTNIFGNSSEVDLGGNVDVDMFLEDGVYKGVIKNNTNYDLKDMVISFGMRSFVNFGNLEKGGELIIDDALKDKSKVKTDIYSILWDDDGGYQARQKGNEVEDWKKSMYRSILDTNANSNIYSYYTSSYYGGYSGYNKISAKGITIYAYIDEALNEIDVSVAGAEPVKYSNNMLKLSAECQMVFNEKYTLPYGVIDIDEIISSGPYDYDYSYGIYCYSTNELQFVFDLSEYSDDILSFMFSADFRANTYGATINAQIYNCTEDTWNQLTYATYSNPHDYMDSDGKVKLKVDTTNLEHVNIPEISLKGAK